MIRSRLEDEALEGDLMSKRMMVDGELGKKDGIR